VRTVMNFKGLSECDNFKEEFKSPDFRLPC
jgi:hypothetical protein